ncbi:VPLPA-CTERM-specific exosortase XrtD [Cycloclasticus pugetii]|uniref:VPLPA-CTERM-specific exosortase XrtD n=1 Tax=Cycloclasticus pugetii TaxID=34068 RepID=UPI002408FCA9|nr:VPLPA-CTERM-specific exosortase XrtD [Cycloclasticus pugetii]MDF1830632.1 VPLPA-CTERM-specific exosortase XrtD [Cycloclasticus pugetii]
MTKKGILIVISLCITAWVYWNGLSEAFLRWGKQEEYSHGYLIPLVSLYILWEKRGLILSAASQPLWSGVWLTVIALLLLLIGEVSAIYLLIQYSFILALIGLSLVTIGKGTKYTLAPILLLLFAIPLPYVIEVLLTAKLQLISSSLGVDIIRFCRIPVYLEGNVIDLGVYKLQVVEACSGLRYLFPLMSLGFITAYFYKTSFWKKALVFLVTIPITILMNSFRIGVIGVLVDYWGISMAEGFLHDFEGWIIFMACAIILFLLIWTLERLTNKGGSLTSAFAVDEVPIASNRSTTNIRNLSFKPSLVFILLLITTGVGIQFLDKRPELYPEHTPFVNFPLQLGEWKGKHEKLDRSVIKKLGMTDYLLANYENTEQTSFLNFYVAYYESQRKGVSPHSPRVCIPGGGWEIAEFKRIEALGHPVNRVLIKKGDHRQLVYYWFQGHGRIIANEYINKWYLFIDSIFKNRTDGSLVRIVTNIKPNESLKEADTRILSFMAESEPQLNKFIEN